MGLMQVWPTHEPHPGWEVMDHQRLVEQLLSRANVADISQIKESMRTLRNQFSVFEEPAVSALTAALSQKQDEFLARQLQHIEKLKVAAPDTIAQTLIPPSRVSRDTTAAT
jgi:hypothetical protein